MRLSDLHNDDNRCRTAWCSLTSYPGHEDVKYSSTKSVLYFHPISMKKSGKYINYAVGLLLSALKEDLFVKITTRHMTLATNKYWIELLARHCNQYQHVTTSTATGPCVPRPRTRSHTIRPKTRSRTPRRRGKPCEQDQGQDDYHETYLFKFLLDCKKNCCLYTVYRSKTIFNKEFRDWSRQMSPSPQPFLYKGHRDTPLDKCLWVHNHLLTKVIVTLI